VLAQSVLPGWLLPRRHAGRDRGGSAGARRRAWP